MKENQEILSLTGLRFIAALYVFLFHIHIRWPITDYIFTNNVLNQGAIGMSLFFMLSGFVLAYRYANGNNSYKDYLVNRFARIYPIYFIAAVITIPWFGVTFSNQSSIEVFLSLGRGIFLVTANIFLIQAWFPQFFNYWNNGGSWSISVEAFCYLLLPLILPYLVRFSIKQLTIVVVICFLLAILPGLSAALFKDMLTNVFYSMPIFRLPEFVIGICINIAVRRGIGENKKIAIYQSFVLGVFILYVGFFGPLFPIYIGHNWIALPVIAFIIFSLSSEQGFVASILSTPLFVWLGKISYCFYSFQALLILSLISYHEKLIHAIPYLANNTVLAVCSLVLLIAVAGLGHHLIEEPIRRWLKFQVLSRTNRKLV